MKTFDDSQLAEQPKHIGKYPSVEAFAQAKLAEAVEDTKHVDWDKVLAKRPKPKS